MTETENTNRATIPYGVNRPFFVMQQFGQLKKEEQDLCVAMMLENGMLIDMLTPLPKMQTLLDTRAAAREVEAQQRRAVQEEYDHARKMPDFMFPKLYSTDQVRCLAYVQHLDQNDLEKLHDQIKNNPIHWSSILSYDTIGALQMLQTEMIRRAIEKQPNKFLETLKNALHSNTEKKPEEPKVTYST